MTKSATLDEFFDRETKDAETEVASQNLLYWTGHPFVDAGLAAILLITNRSKPEELSKEDVEKAIKFAAELYATKNWSSGYLHGMIFPNSGLLMANPSMKERTPEKIANNLRMLLNEFDAEGSPKCILCGIGKVYAKREIYLSSFPLLGTGKVPNFFHSANVHGADICAHCLFLTQFMPIASYRLSRVLVIHAYPYEIMLELTREAINDVKKEKLASQARGFRRPENFLFHIVGEITRKIENDKFWENASVTLYYFICNNQNQVLDVIHIPTPVLRFVAYASRVDYLGWKRIVAMGWRNVRKEEDFEKFEKERRNTVYSRLINNESILPFFYNMKERNVNAKWILLEFYCSEVMGLDKNLLEFIKEVGDRIVETLEKLPDHKLDDEVRSLERAEKLYQFEAFFIRVEKLRQKLGVKEPLMTFDDFARILTAYGEDINVSWRTVKNLLLFRLYERLHDRLARKSEDVKETENEEVEELSIYGGGVE